MPETGWIRKYTRGALALLALSVPAALIFFLSSMDYTFADPGDSVLMLGIKHPGKRIIECDEAALILREAEKYREMLRETDRARMRIERLGDCSRERHPVYVEVYIDGEVRGAGYHEPSGLGDYGASYVYAKYTVRPGTHRVAVRMRDSGGVADRFDYVYEDGVEFRAGYMRAVEFDEAGKRLL